MNTGFCSSVPSLHCDYKTLKHWNCMHLTFCVSCLLARNVSLRCFCGSCVVVCGGALSVLFSTWEKSLSVKLHSASATAPATDAPPPPNSGFDALSGSLRLAWLCPWAISSLFALPLLSVSLSVALTTSTPPPLLLPLPHYPPAILSLSVENHEASLFQWHVYRIFWLNYDPGVRPPQNSNKI